jgi:hypothetical protein
MMQVFFAISTIALLFPQIPKSDLKTWSKEQAELDGEFMRFPASYSRGNRFQINADSKTFEEAPLLFLISFSE